MSSVKKALLLAPLAAAATGVAVYRALPDAALLPIGKILSPMGEQADAGSFPANMAMSPDGRFLAVTTTGFRQRLTLFDVATGRQLSRVEMPAKSALYYGLAWTGSGDDLTLHASRGFEDKLASYKVGADGTMTEGPVVTLPAGGLKAFPAGMATLDGAVYAVGNESYEKTGWKGGLFRISGGAAARVADLGGFPLGLISVGGRLLAANEADGTVSVIAPGGGVSSIRVGERPAYLAASADGKTAWVANANSDTVSEIDLSAGRVRRTILVRPPSLRGIAGATPLGLTPTPDGRHLLVAMADLNAVAVVDLAKGDLRGYLPVGWYPTAVAVSPDGRRLFVANAKGIVARHPNGENYKGRGQYGPNLIEGTLATIDLPAALADLPRRTAQVMANNRLVKAPKAEIRNPGIEHVVYVVRENRTYDQVFGDLPQGEADPSLTLFPREVTPNAHALVERFGLFDNFYVCAEVSADGWNWSTAGMANEYTQRNTFTNYSKRGRAYDFEGATNSTARTMQGQTDPAEPAGGYIWDAVDKAGRSQRNYGFFTQFGEKDAPGENEETGDEATKPVLAKSTSPHFRRYDLSYPDSEAWIKHGLPPAPKQRLKAGPKGDPSRMTAWLREYDEMSAAGKVPRFMTVRLGRDHTQGTTKGQYSPRAMVADNDYALGQLVERISKGPLWKKTAIFVVEDDAQAGFDHVDCHRSPFLLVSPYTERGKVNSMFLNTDSVLRTMTELLGAKAWNHYVATAPLAPLARRAVNAEAYAAILPAKEIVGEINGAGAYRAADSAKISLYQEESMEDIELNDILWGALKGARTARPPMPGARWNARD